MTKRISGWRSRSEALRSRRPGGWARVGRQRCGRWPSDPARPHLKLAEIFDEVFSWVTVPSVEGFQYGHVARKLTLPFGLRARLDANSGTLSVLESSVE